MIVLSSVLFAGAQMIAATAMCGMVYAAFAGQPLTIIGSTGPVLAFIAVLYKTSVRMVREKHTHTQRGGPRRKAETLANALCETPAVNGFLDMCCVVLCCITRSCHDTTNAFPQNATLTATQETCIVTVYIPQDIVGVLKPSRAPSFVM